MKIKKVYLGRKQIYPERQSTIERSYDFAGKSLADFQANGGNNINTDGSYNITSNGIQQTSSSNDKDIRASVLLPTERTTAKKIEIYGTFYHIRASRSSGPSLQIRTDLTTKIPTNMFDYYMSFVPNGGYKNTNLYLNNTKIYDIQQDRTTGITTLKSIIDFQNKTVQTQASGANTWDRTDNLTDSQLSAIKNFTYFSARQGRGYSSENGVYIKSMGYKIYF